MSEHAKHPSATKRGPGRYHADGHEKASPIKPKGAPFGFVVHRAPVEKQARRNTMAAVGGRRQYLKKTKADKREAKRHDAASRARLSTMTFGEAA